MATASWIYTVTGVGAAFEIWGVLYAIDVISIAKRRWARFRHKPQTVSLGVAIGASLVMGLDLHASRPPLASDISAAEAAQIVRREIDEATKRQNERMDAIELRVTKETAEAVERVSVAAQSRVAKTEARITIGERRAAISAVLVIIGVVLSALANILGA